MGFKVKKYKIHATEKLFNRYKIVGDKIINLGGLVQNDGIEVTQKQLKDWQKDMENVSDELVAIVTETVDNIEEL